MVDNDFLDFDPENDFVDDVILKEDQKTNLNNNESNHSILDFSEDSDEDEKIDSSDNLLKNDSLEDLSNDEDLAYNKILDLLKDPDNEESSVSDSSSDNTILDDGDLISGIVGWDSADFADSLSEKAELDETLKSFLENDNSEENITNFDEVALNSQEDDDFTTLDFTDFDDKEDTDEDEDFSIIDLEDEDFEEIDQNPFQSTLKKEKKPKKDEKDNEKDNLEEKSDEIKNPNEKENKVKKPNFFTNIINSIKNELKGEDSDIPDYAKPIKNNSEDEEEDLEENNKKGSKKNKKQKKQNKDNFIKKLYLGLVSILFKIISLPIVFLSELPLVGKIFKLLLPILKLIEKIAKFLPLILIILILFLVNFFAVPMKTSTSLPDMGEVTFSSFTYDKNSNEATGIIQNTGEVIAEITPEFYIYSYNPNTKTIVSFFKFTEQQKCVGEPVTVDIDDMKKVEVKCSTETKGFLPRSSGKLIYE